MLSQDDNFDQWEWIFAKPPEIWSFGHLCTRRSSLEVHVQDSQISMECLALVPVLNSEGRALQQQLIAQKKLQNRESLSHEKAFWKKRQTLISILLVFNI